MKVIFSLLLVLSFCFSPALAGVVKNPDTPQKGTWDFAPQKAWAVDSAGKDVLVEIRMLAVDPKGNLFIGEAKQKKFHIFDPKGKLVTSFGRGGEGPGEIRFLFSYYIRDNQLIIPELSMIHYYSLEGEFIKDVNPGKMMFSLNFADGNRVFKQTHTGIGKAEGPNYIELYNLETKETKKLAKMDFKEGILRYAKDGRRFALRIQDTSTALILAPHKESLFYGNSDKYRVNQVDFNGKELLSFTVEQRKKNPVSEATRRKLFQDTTGGLDQLPKAVVDEMVSQIPGQSPYFNRILVDTGGRIYVSLLDMAHRGRQGIDIFSPDGKYLYRAHFDLSAEFARILTYEFSFHRGELFVFAEDEEGDRQVVKYKIKLP